MKNSVKIHSNISGASGVPQNYALEQAILTDSFHRQLTYLRVSITDFCNFRCDYCLPNGYQGRPNKHELTLFELKTLFLAFASMGTKKLRLTGGEPSIRKDLPQIIAIAKATKGIKTVALSTNGYKMHKHMDAWQSAGLDQVNISLDSFDKDTFYRLTGFDILPNLLSDIDALLSHSDIKVKLNAVLLPDTVQDNLQKALDYIKRRPISYRFIEFMQTSGNKNIFFAEHATTTHIKTHLKNLGFYQTARQSDSGPAVEYAHADYAGKIGIIEPYAPKFCDTCNRLRVSSQGKIHLCLFDSKNYDVRDYLMRGDVDGLQKSIQNMMPIKPKHHHLKKHSGLMQNLSMVGG